MEMISQVIREAVELLSSGDKELVSVTVLTLLTSGSAIVLACLLGIPTGIALGLARFPGRRLIITLVNTGMGLPPVLVGLVVALLLWRSGPLGWLGWMYTPKAMVFAQLIISTPLVIGVSLAAVGSLQRDWFVQVRSLGASAWQTLLLLLKETRLGLAAALMAGLGRILAEVGAVMMVGGNLRMGGVLKGDTRVLTTSLLKHVEMGKFERALALGIILLAITFAANLCLTLVQQRARARTAS